MQHKFLTATLTAAIGLSAASALHADTIGFVVGGYSWEQEYEGDIQSSSNIIDEIDINDDLGFDDETGSVVYFKLEHPVPFIPNIMLQQTELEIKETSSPTKNFTFDGTVYAVTDQITTTSDLSHTDATLYYEILDNWISIDLGLTVRLFDEGFELTSAISGTEVLEVDEAVPLLYVGAKVELPLTGLFVSADINGIGLGDASLIDYKASIGYESSLGLGIEAGLRSFEIDYDDDDEQANLTIDGAFLGVFYHF